MNARKRHGILENLAKSTYLPSIAAHSSCLPIGLAVSRPIHDYNLHIEESDKNAQQKAFYTSN